MNSVEIPESSAGTVIIICGPTAVGKTNFAIKLARKLKTKIISADSRQCYKELNIGVAKPTPEELSAVHHYFINSHTIHEEVNAIVFEQYALQAAEQIFREKPAAVMVGGTGLYIKAFCEGMDNIPAIDTAVRKTVVNAYQENGLQYLQEQLQEKDPDFWQVAEQQNPQRLMRALEVFLSTGKSITNYRKGSKVERPFTIIKIGLELPRAELYERINRRVNNMMEEGLLNEVIKLTSMRNSNALQTVGYNELFDHLEHKLSLGEAIEKIKTNTRHYAKRQLTWFKKEEDIKWYNANEADVEEILPLLQFKR
jgi:tRNA dimethylallyltransferase